MMSHRTELHGRHALSPAAGGRCRAIRPRSGRAAPLHAAEADDAALAALDALQTLEALAADDAWPVPTDADAERTARGPNSFAEGLPSSAGPALVPVEVVDDDGLSAWLGSVEPSAPIEEDDDAAQSGELTPAALPLLLAELRARRRTGLLLIQAGDDQCRLAFALGELVHVSGSRAEHRFEAQLLTRGLLTPLDLERVAGEARQQGRTLGGLLLERGLLDAASLRLARAEQARRVLVDLVACDDGDYVFGPRERAGDDEEILPTGDLLLDLVRQFDDPDVVRFALGDLGAPLAIAPEAYAAGGPPLASVARAVLSGIAGRATAREVLARTPGDPDDARRSLLALITAALVRRQ